MRNSRKMSFLFPRLIQRSNIRKVVELFLEVHKFVIREHDELLAAILFQKLRMKFEHLSSHLLRLLPHFID